MMPALPSPPEAAPAPMVALIEDDPVMGGALAQRLVLEGYRVAWSRTGREALASLAADPPHAVVCDIRLPDLSGEEVFAALRPSLPDTPVVFVTGHAGIDQAVRLVKAGAADYLAKPFEVRVLLERLAEVIRAPATTGALGVSAAMRRAEATLRRVAELDSTLLLTGESGVGKEVAGRFVHAISARGDRPFVAVNCAAIPDTLIESALFGHERFAFTGAERAHTGFFEEAADGTLFLDEIGDLPAATQTKLLRVVQERAFLRLGATRPIALRARLVCATHVDLPAAVRAGKFRQDLYYRLAVIPVDLPPLRARSDDILPLLRAFLMEFTVTFARDLRGIASDAERMALAHAWPGNVRELRNRVERAVALAGGPTLQAADLFPEAVAAGAVEAALPSLADAVADAERRHIDRALAEAGGRVEEAARLLGVSRSTLFEKIRRMRG
jgi:DNA-binding NtrC family response regulator